MKRGLLIGLLIGIAGGAVTGLLLAFSRRRSPQLTLGFEPPPRRFLPFKNRISIRFEDTADFIKPSI
jgi:hypothetical protein